MSKLSIAATILAALAFLPSCSERQPPPELLVTDDIGLFKSEIWKTEKEQVEASANALLTKWPSFLPRQSEDPKATWQVILNFEEALEGEAVAEVDGKPPEDAVARRVTISARARVVTSKPELWKQREFQVRRRKVRNFRLLSSNQESVLSEVEAALDLLQFFIELQKATPADLLQMLEAESSERQLYVVSEVRKRKIRESVPALINWLKKENLHPEIELELIGALIAIRDKRAVKALIDSSQRRHEIYLTQIIFGIAEIGGKQAEAYLFTVKAGHPKPEIRKHASDALSELLRRRGKQNE